jgi:hypothetical protein
MTSSSQLSVEIGVDGTLFKMETSNQQRYTLTRACDQCIKVKRKCTRDLPHCRRCAKRKITCYYRNEPLAGRSHRPLAKTLDTDNNLKEKIVSLEHLISTSTKPEHSSSQNTYYVTQRYRFNATTLDTLRFLGYPEVILSMDQPSVSYLFVCLRGMPETFLRCRGTPFIHSQMYKDGLPPLLQTIHSLCSKQANEKNQMTVYEAISKASRELILSIPAAHTFSAKLVFTQPLILLQIITLFFPTISILQQMAENRIPLLQKFIREIYHTAPATLPLSMSRYQAWLLVESCRRTIHVAHLVDELHSMLTRGTFTLRLFISALPIDRNGGLWDWDVSQLVDGEENKQLEEYLRSSGLISYRELMEKWDGGKYKHPTPFDEILIIACAGVGNVKRARTVN